jgi:hypothetical protein
MNLHTKLRMKKISPATARTLTWLAAVLALIGCMVMSPSAALLALTLAALATLLPALLGEGRVRLLAAVLLLATIAFAVSRYPEYKREQTLYRRHIDPQFRQQPLTK